MIFSKHGREKVRAAEPRWLPKTILRFLTLVVCIISLGLAAATWVEDLRIIWLVIPLALSILWNLANLMVRVTRSKPMHPGANVGCDLILWIIFIIVIIFCIFLDVDWLYYDPGYYYSGYYYGYGGCGGYQDCSDLGPLRDEKDRLATIGLVASGFACAATILHFTLFIWACVDTHRYRHRNVDERAAAMAAAMVTRMQQTGQWGPHQNGGMQYPQGTYQPYPAQGETKDGQWQPAPQQYQQQQWQPNNISPLRDQKRSLSQAEVDQNATTGRERPVPQQPEEEGGVRGYYEPDVMDGPHGAASVPAAETRGVQDVRGKGRADIPEDAVAGPSRAMRGYSPENVGTSR